MKKRYGCLPAHLFLLCGLLCLLLTAGCGGKPADFLSITGDDGTATLADVAYDADTGSLTGKVALVLASGKSGTLSQLTDRYGLTLSYGDTEKPLPTSGNQLKEEQDAQSQLTMNFQVWLTTNPPAKGDTLRIAIAGFDQSFSVARP